MGGFELKGNTYRISGEGLVAIPQRELVVRLLDVQFDNIPVYLRPTIAEVIVSSHPDVKEGDIVLYSRGLLPVSHDMKVESVFPRDLWGKIDLKSFEQTQKGGRPMDMKLGWKVIPLNGYCVIVPLEEPEYQVGTLYLPKTGAQQVLVPGVLVDVYSAAYSESPNVDARKFLERVKGNVVLYNPQASRQVFPTIGASLVPYNGVIAMVDVTKGGSKFFIREIDKTYIETFYNDDPEVFRPFQAMLESAIIEVLAEGGGL